MDKNKSSTANSSHSYLTNCREIGLFAVKKSKPTFNSKYDNAIYIVIHYKEVSIGFIQPKKVLICLRILF